MDFSAIFADWEKILSFAVTLLIILDPLGNAPPVQNTLKAIQPRRRVTVLLRETFFIILILAFFFIMGGRVLGYLGVDNYALKLSGGILLLLIAIGLVFPKANVLGGEGGHGPAHKGEPFIVPISVPLVVGPGAIAYVMLQASLCQGIEQKIGYLTGVTGACVATGVLLIFAERIISRLGDNVSSIMERLMGILLILLAVQMCMDGITAYVHQL